MSAGWPESPVLAGKVYIPTFFVRQVFPTFFVSYYLRDALTCSKRQHNFRTEAAQSSALPKFELAAVGPGDV